jgi:hypothetical protein
VGKPHMTRELKPRERATFRKACRDLRKLVDAGWFLYLDGGGNLHVMTGESHDEGGQPRQDRIVDSETCGAGGGDW